MLVWRWEWEAAHHNKGVVHLGPAVVLDYSGPSKPSERSSHARERSSVVPARWGYSQYSQCDPGVAQCVIPSNIDQSMPRSWVVSTLVWLETPRLLLLGLLERPCAWEQSQDNSWTEISNHTEHQSYHQERTYKCNNFARLSSLSPAERWTSAAHIVMCYRYSEDRCWFVKMLFS